MRTLVSPVLEAHKPMLSDLRHRKEVAQLLCEEIGINQSGLEFLFTYGNILDEYYIEENNNNE